VNKRKLQFEIKAVKESPDDKYATLIEGYASTRDKDRGNDIVEPTAFTNTMPGFMKNPVLLFNHNMDNIIGQVLDYKIDDVGLWVKAGISKVTEVARDVASLVKADILKSFSFMYDIIDWVPAQREGQANIIREVELYEVSVVTIPMNPEAMIAEAKSKGINLEYFKSDIRHTGGQKVDNQMPDNILTKEELDAAMAKHKEETTLNASEINDGIKKQFADVRSELKESQDKIASEQVEKINRLSGDVEELIKNFEKEKKELLERKQINSMVEPFPAGFNSKSAVMMPMYKANSVLSSRQAGQIKELHEANDDLMLVDALLECSSKIYDGVVIEGVRLPYDKMPREERIKGLKTYDRFSEFRKAMDTATATEGAEWVPTDFSASMQEMVKTKLKVANLFTEIQQPTATYTLPIEGADTLATLAGERTTVPTSLEQTEQTPGTANINLVAKKARSRIQVSSELTEDSIIPSLPFAKMKAVNGIVRAIERAIINGDDSGSHFDTGHTVAATDFRAAWDGLRYHAIGNSLTVDLGTFDETNLRKLPKSMGKYAETIADLVYIMAVEIYLGQMLINLDQVQTVDKYGPAATVLQGELAKFDGKPIITSEFMEINQDSTGIYSGAGHNRASVLLPNTSCWIRGAYRPITTYVDFDASYDVYQVYVYKRCAFTYLFDPSTENIVYAGINVDAS